AEKAEKRKALVEARAKQLGLDAEAEKEDLIAAATAKGDKIIEDAKIAATKMLESDDEGIDEGLKAFVKSQKGKRCTFTPFLSGDTAMEGTIIGCMVDKRVNGVFFRILGDDKRTYHKNAATSDVEIAGAQAEIEDVDYSEPTT